MLYIRRLEMFGVIILIAISILLLVLWIMIAAKVGHEASELGESAAFYVLVSLFCTPVTAILLLLLIGRRKGQKQIDTISQNLYAAAETVKDLSAKLDKDKE